MFQHQDFSFRPEERMKLRKNIETLFQSGEAFLIFPLRMIHLKVNLSSQDAAKAPIQLGISVPKKRIRKAVQRNLVKRRIREAWRLQKGKYFPNRRPPNFQIQVFVIYLSDKVLSFSVIEEAVGKCLQRLQAIYHLPDSPSKD